MPQLTVNQEYCSIARALSVLGERWTLLIVRDLLSGPKRFTELERLVVGISPKWLTARLRSLEDAGLVKRLDRKYSLTPQGESLRATLEELSLWATSFESREPRADEIIVPEHDMWALEVFLNRNQVTWNRPAKWAIDLDDDGQFELIYDGQTWTWGHPEDGEADVRIETTARRWATLLTRAQAGEPNTDNGLELVGSKPEIAAFKKLANIKSTALGEA